MLALRCGGAGGSSAGDGRTSCTACGLAKSAADLRGISGLHGDVSRRYAESADMASTTVRLQRNRLESSRNGFLRAAELKFRVKISLIFQWLAGGGGDGGGDKTAEKKRMQTIARPASRVG